MADRDYAALSKIDHSIDTDHDMREMHSCEAILTTTAVVVRMAESDVATSGEIVGIGITDHPTTDAASQIGHPGGVLVPGWAGPEKKASLRRPGGVKCGARRCPARRTT